MEALSRRELLRAASLGAASLAFGGASRWASAQASLGGAATAWAFVNLNISPTSFEVYPGYQTTCYRYVGSFKSSPGTVEAIPGSYLGPIIRFKKGQVARVTFTNTLAENTIVHWHGLHLPEYADGLPTQIVGPGATVTRTFPIVNRAGTYWYHPHPHMATATQVYKGLAGMVIVSDPEEQALALPRGQYDMPLVIQDRRFDANYQYVYNSGGGMGQLGNRILINGWPNYTLSAATRVYRFRILNGSNSRIYKLAWNNSVPMVLIGTDGGLIPAPVTKPYIMLAPGERVEIWADFSQLAVGSNFKLQSLAFTGVGQNAGQTPAQGTLMDLMNVSIDRQETETLTLPAVLTPIQWEDPNTAVNKLEPRHFPISFTTEGWVLNGSAYQPNVLASNETVKLGDLEIWEFSHILNSMTLAAHPIHVHGVQFQIIERTIQAERASAYETVRYGYTDEGWKDTFLVMPGETVKILIRFTRYPGMFVYHCHNLEHEDMGMMRHYQIVP
ncbi:MAG: multicopper oxidase family protein [Fimbriimonadales bacterium]